MVGHLCMSVPAVHCFSSALPSSVVHCHMCHCGERCCVTDCIQEQEQEDGDEQLQQPQRKSSRAVKRRTFDDVEPEQDDDDSWEIGCESESRGAGTKQRKRYGPDGQMGPAEDRRFGRLGPGVSKQHSGSLQLRDRLVFLYSSKNQVSVAVDRLNQFCKLTCILLSSIPRYLRSPAVRQRLRARKSPSAAQTRTHKHHDCSRHRCRSWSASPRSPAWFRVQLGRNGVRGLVRCGLCVWRYC